MSAENIIPLAIERFERTLISYAKEITGDIESARDAVQETFLRLSRQDLVEIEPRLAPWLFYVCRNCALDHRRKVVRFSAEALNEEHKTEEHCPAKTLMAAEDAECLRGLVSQLPERQRELLNLKFEGDLSYKEMSEVMKMSVSHVGVQLHEAIQTLRRLWSSEHKPVSTL
jgi:RNA polymerase sigma-70 factor (ECF subfamily)